MKTTFTCLSALNKCNLRLQLTQGVKHALEIAEIYFTYYYCYYIRLTAFFQDNLGKVAPER